MFQHGSSNPVQGSPLTIVFYIKEQYIKKVLVSTLLVVLGGFSFFVCLCLGVSFIVTWFIILILIAIVGIQYAKYKNKSKTK